MRVIVGRIGRPHGIRGEVVIGVRTDEPDLRFTVGAVLDVERTPTAETGSQLTVAAKRWHSGQLLISFAGITDRTAAAELTGSWLSVDTSQLPAPQDPDEFRDHELIGLSVRTAAGDQVGVVSDVLHYGQDLLVVRRAPADSAAKNSAAKNSAVQNSTAPNSKDVEYLVPFVKAIVPEVDVSAGVIVIDPPPGLLDPASAS
jgi:16S rRNA processing protein RimM